VFRLALISDVHADVHALRDALTAIDRLGCDAVMCAGDIVDYGLFPDETIALLRERRIATARGNHDRWAVEDDPRSSVVELSGASQSWLAGLPLSLRATHEGIRVAVHHARPGDDMRGIPTDVDAHEARQLLQLADADVLVVGHTHHAFRLDVEDAGTIVNPAALLRDPATASPDATGTFGVLELPSLAFSVWRATGEPATYEQTRVEVFPREAPTRP
jgi:putative phosphoesterase